MAKFEWPCNREDAHGPHPRQSIGYMPGRMNLPSTGPGEMFVGEAVYLGRGGRVTTEATCPGVQAHPATMIGGNNA